MTEWEVFNNRVEELIRTFATTVEDPQGDIEPCLIMADGPIIGDDFAMVGLGPFMNDEAGKDLVSLDLIPSMIFRGRPKFTAFVSAVFMAKEEKQGDESPLEAQARVEKGLRPSERPDREELILITTASHEGHVRLSRAYILRDDEHSPGLTEFEQWESYEPGEKVELIGRFVEPLVKMTMLVNTETFLKAQKYVQEHDEVSPEMQDELIEAMKEIQNVFSTG